MKFIRTTRYEKDLKRIGATDADHRAIVQGIANNPLAGDVIRGLDGMRKARFAFGGRGKSGGGRVIYFLQLDAETVLLLTAYAKNEKADLSSDDRKTLKALLEELRK